MTPSCTEVPMDLLAASTTEVVVAITVAAILFCIWLYANFVLVLDDISLGAKVLWFLALLLLLPVAVPTYLYLRHRRRSNPAAQH
jgi:hypothetical protein